MRGGLCLVVRRRLGEVRLEFPGLRADLRPGLAPGAGAYRYRLHLPDRARAVPVPSAPVFQGISGPSGRGLHPGRVPAGGCLVRFPDRRAHPWRSRHRRADLRRRTLVFGAGKRAAAIREIRRKADRRGFRVVANVGAAGDGSVNRCDKYVDHDRPLLAIAREREADEIVVAMDDRRGNLPIDELLACKVRGIDCLDLLGFLERETGKIRIDLVNASWMIFSSGFRITPLRRATKRGLDLFVCVLAMVIALPVMALCALAIKLEDGLRAPVFYRQRRVGLYGENFDVLKFRSMIQNAEAPGQAQWAEKNDPRVTRVGGVLRKLRFDELPQLLNVLKGEMSVVGPRPERPEFVSQLKQNIAFYAERHTVKPGITGWAQLKYQYGSTEQDAIEKLQYDLYYVKNHSLLLDLVIMLQTAEVILWGKGAR